MEQSSFFNVKMAAGVCQNLICGRKTLMFALRVTFSICIQTKQKINNFFKHENTHLQKHTKCQSQVTI